MFMLYLSPTQNDFCLALSCFVLLVNLVQKGSADRARVNCYFFLANITYQLNVALAH